MNFPHHVNYLQHLPKSLFLAEDHCNEHSTEMRMVSSLKSSFAWWCNTSNKSVLSIEGTSTGALAAFFTGRGVHRV